MPRSIENRRECHSDWHSSRCQGRSFENSREPGLLPLPLVPRLADLALERDHLFLQFVLCCLQRAILRLDLRQHLVERVGQPPLPRRRRPS